MFVGAENHSLKINNECGLCYCMILAEYEMILNLGVSLHPSCNQLNFF